NPFRQAVAPDERVRFDSAGRRQLLKPFVRDRAELLVPFGKKPFGGHADCPDDPCDPRLRLPHRVCNIAGRKTTLNGTVESGNENGSAAVTSRTGTCRSTPTT